MAQATMNRRRFSENLWNGYTAFAQGIAGGLVAGTVFAVAFVLLGWATHGTTTDAFWDPLRKISAIILGEEALQDSYSLWGAVPVAIGLHYALSMLFGVIFTLAFWWMPSGTKTPALLLIAASLFGTALWIVDIQWIARWANWDWFPDSTDQFWQGFVAHTFAFGTALGLYLAWVRSVASTGDSTTSTARMGGRWD